MIKLKHHTTPTACVQQHRTTATPVSLNYNLKGIYTEGHLWLTDQVLYQPNWIIWNEN